ncbi:hypothetical protein N0V85_001642 [Neurospora sp. IMI 360204]|nr:hypothetical protein N0V85_001642 [Neurospora sp. IMI 360204]
MNSIVTNHTTAPSGKLNQLLDTLHSYRPTPQQNLYLIAFLFPSILLYLINNRYQKQKHRRQKHHLSISISKPTTTSATSTEKQQLLIKDQREPGKWPPSSYVFPTPPPYPNWSLTETKALPYRPFRYGPVYHTTMGLRTVAPENWIELDNQYAKYHSDKAARIAERGDKVIMVAPEAAEAAVELVKELVEYLPERYPSLFRRTAAGIDNLWSGESFDISVLTGTGEKAVEEGRKAMEIAARLIQDDLALMVEQPEDDQYHLLAGAVLLPGFWRLTDKFGMSLAELHTSGDVPQYKEKLHRGMYNLFRRLRPEQMVGRNNYFIQVDDSLAWSWSIGSEDDTETSWSTAEKNRAIEHHYFRSERQTLRRLPKTGAMCFTIRTYFEPIKAIAEEDYVPGRLASAVRSWGDDVAKYKGKERYGEVLLEFLDKKHQEQVGRGLDLSREDECRAYPF